MNDIEFLDALAFLFEPARWKVPYGGRGAGKCLAVGTRVIMADGSLRAVEHIWPGESVMGPDSLPRKVLGTTRGRSQMYRVKQTSGMDYVVNDAHILSLKKSESCKNDIGEISKAGNPRRPNGRYGGYPDICNINVVEAFNQSARWKANFRGYKAGLLDFPEKAVEIDPWYLGAWLGDGKSNDNILYSEDSEIIRECYRYANELSMNVSFYHQPNNKSIGIKIKRIAGTEFDNPLRSRFSFYNLFDNKHIPLVYKTNSEQTRLQVLAGLLDTDGHCYNNGYQIIQTNKTLAYDIKFLADSLGFKTNLREKATICSNNGVKGLAYRLSINGDTWRIPCRIKRKQVKKEDVKKNKDFLLSQVEIEPIGEGDYAGFSLDGDRLFLLEDGTVTHNTEGIAIALIILARTKKLRILCGREFQNSIDESVKQTIEANIASMGLEDEFQILGKQIICKRTGSRFFFMGLRYNINKIKSLGRIDICWIEEADKTSKTTLDKLSPTIRGRSNFEEDRGGPFGKGPEIWISFNPDLDSDEVYKRFVLEKEKYAPDYVLIDRSTEEVVLNKDGTIFKPDPDSDEYKGSNQFELVRYAIVTKINYWDNKWFPPDLRMEMNILKVSNKDKYLEVWEGNTKQVLEGAIYAEELREVLLEKRRSRVAYDPNRPVYTCWDLGHSDKTAIWFIQRVGLEYNIINYYEDRLKKMPFYISKLQEFQYNYGMHFLPHDGSAETLSNVTPEKQLKVAYPGKVKIVERPSKKAIAINAVRSLLPLCNFDEKNTSEGWQCLVRYAYKVDEDTGTFSKEPEHNTPWSHGADGMTTFALSLKSEQDSKKPKSKFSEREGRILPHKQQTSSWMGHS